MYTPLLRPRSLPGHLWCTSKYVFMYAAYVLCRHGGGGWDCRKWADMAATWGGGRVAGLRLPYVSVRVFLFTLRAGDLSANCVRRTVWGSDWPGTTWLCSSVFGSVEISEPACNS